MFIHRKEYSVLYKAIAMALVCLFCVNTFSFADIDTLAPLAGNPQVYSAMRQMMEKKLSDHQEPIDSVIERYAKDKKAKDLFSYSGLEDLKNEFIRFVSASDADSMLARLRETLRSTGGQIQVIFVKSENDLPVFEGKKVWGHAGTYVTVFALEGEEKTPEGQKAIVGRLFHEIRARSNSAKELFDKEFSKQKPSTEQIDAFIKSLQERFEHDNFLIQNQIEQNANIANSLLKQEFASLTFAVHPDVMNRDYVMAEEPADTEILLKEKEIIEYTKGLGDLSQRESIKDGYYGVYYDKIINVLALCGAGFAAERLEEIVNADRVKIVPSEGPFANINGYAYRDDSGKQWILISYLAIFWGLGSLIAYEAAEATGLPEPDCRQLREIYQKESSIADFQYNDSTTRAEFLAQKLHRMIKKPSLITNRNLKTLVNITMYLRLPKRLLKWATGLLNYIGHKNPSSLNDDVLNHMLDLMLDSDFLVTPRVFAERIKPFTYNPLAISEKTVAFLLQALNKYYEEERRQLIIKILSYISKINPHAFSAANLKLCLEMLKHDSDIQQLIPLFRRNSESFNEENLNLVLNMIEQKATYSCRVRDPAQLLRFFLANKSAFTDNVRVRIMKIIKEEASTTYVEGLVALYYFCQAKGENALGEYLDYKLQDYDSAKLGISYQAMRTLETIYFEGLPQLLDFSDLGSQQLARTILFSRLYELEKNKRLDKDNICQLKTEFKERIMPAVRVLGHVCDHLEPVGVVLFFNKGYYSNEELNSLRQKIEFLTEVPAMRRGTDEHEQNLMVYWYSGNLLSTKLLLDYLRSLKIACSTQIYKVEGEGDIVKSLPQYGTYFEVPLGNHVLPLFGVGANLAMHIKQPDDKIYTEGMTSPFWGAQIYREEHRIPSGGGFDTLYLGIFHQAILGQPTAQDIIPAYQEDLMSQVFLMTAMQRDSVDLEKYQSPERAPESFALRDAYRDFRHRLTTIFKAFDFSDSEIQSFFGDNYELSDDIDLTHVFNRNELSKVTLLLARLMRNPQAKKAVEDLMRDTSCKIENAALGKGLSRDLFRDIMQGVMDIKEVIPWLMSQASSPDVEKAKWARELLQTSGVRLPKPQPLTKSHTRKPKGSAATLLRFMKENGIFADNPKTAAELANTRGGNDSPRNIGREIYVGVGTGLILGDGKKGYYLPDWLKNADIEEMIKQNHELDIAEPSEEQIRAVATRVKSNNQSKDYVKVNGISEEILSEAIEANLKTLKKQYYWIEADVLRSYSWEGVQRAAEKYDFTKGTSSKTYLHSKGVLEAIDALRRDGLIERKDRAPIPRTFSLEGTKDENGDLQQGAESTPDEQSERTTRDVETRDMVNHALQLCSPAARFILESYYIQEKTLKQIADAVGLSESMISLLHKEAMANIKQGKHAFVDFEMGSSKIAAGLPDRIERMRKELYMELEDVSLELGKVESVVMSWEKGERIPTYNEFTAFTNAFKVPFNWLVNGDKEPDWDSVRAEFFKLEPGWDSRIKNTRTTRNLSQGEIAASLNLTSGSISHWETGLDQPIAKYIVPLAKALRISLSYLIRGKVNFTFADKDETRKHIVEWFGTGKGLVPGEYFSTQVRSGYKKHITADKEPLQLAIPVNAKKGESVNVVFVAEEDVNHGPVLNCYYQADFEVGDRSQPIITYKYFAKHHTAISINLAASDIVYAYYDLRNVQSLNRPLRTTIAKWKYFQVGAMDDDGIYQSFRRNIPKDVIKTRKVSGGEEIVVTLEDDKNHGQVINVYWAKDYDSGRKAISPLATYKYYLRKSKPTATRVDLGELDVVSAYKGNELEVLGRQAKTYIRKVADIYGKCGIYYLENSEAGEEEETEFRIPKKYMDKGALDKKVVVRVERDINQGQIINVYFEKDFREKKDSAIPLVTYKYFSESGICRPVNLAALDVFDYYFGRTDIKPANSRSFEIPVLYQNNYGGQFNAKTDTEGRRKIFFPLLLSVAKKYFKSDGKHQRADVTLREDEDYGTYVEISKKGDILCRYYWFKDLNERTTAYFSRLAFVDYVLGDKNIRGEPIKPRECYYPAKVKDKGTVFLSYRGREAYALGLKLLKGKNIVFVPKDDGKGDYLIHVHDADEYRRNKNRKPEHVLVRDTGSKKLIPVELASAPLVDSSATLTGEQLAVFEKEWQSYPFNMPLFLKLLAPILGLESVLDQGKSVFVFSEKITFDNNLAYCLPKLIKKKGIKIAVLLNGEDKQKAAKEKVLIDKLNEGKPENEKIKYANTIAELRANTPSRRYYYFRMKGDPEDPRLNGVFTMPELSIDMVKRIIDAIGKACRIEPEKLPLLHELARKFAEAA